MNVAFPTLRLACALLLGLAACGEDPAATLEPEPASAPPIAELQGGAALHVSTRGSDNHPGTSGQPFRTLQRAVGAARPGDTILLHGGTYDEVVVVKTSGTASQPITIRPAGDGAVTLRRSFSPTSCSATSPTRNRTLQFVQGADHWRVEGLTIVNGVLIVGTKVSGLDESVFRNRSLPGRGVRDREAARRTLTQLGIDSADGIRIVGNRIFGRGIQLAAGQDGLIERNEVAQIDCGVGAAIWLNAFTDGYVVRGNHIHHVEESAKHFMSEGIRMGRASSYNLVEGNTVEDLEGDARGIASDVNASWNVIRSNRVARAYIGFNEQAGGWGNEWTQNAAENNRGMGYAIYSQGWTLSRPNDRVPSQLVMWCNRSSGSAFALRIGSVQKSKFLKNAFADVRYSEDLASYWRSAGNTWEGSSSPPWGTASATGC